MNNTISIGEPWMWAAYFGFVLVMLVLFVFGGRKAHKASVKDAALEEIYQRIHVASFDAKFCPPQPPDASDIALDLKEG